MKKPQKVNIANIKAHFSKYLRLVRNGEEITVLDRDHPVAKLIPYSENESAIKVIKANKSSHSLHELVDNLPLMKSATPIDSLATLIEDRSKR